MLQIRYLFQDVVSLKVLLKNIHSLQLQGQTGAVGFSRLAFRMVTQQPLAYFKNRLDLKKEKVSVFSPGSYDSFFQLVGHHDQDTSTTLFWILVCCVVHLRTLQIGGYFGPNRAKKPDQILTQDELMIGAVMVDIFRSLRYNMHAIVKQVSRMQR